MSKGYTVKFSKTVIEEICDKPEKFGISEKTQALADAETLYEFGVVSKSWLDYVKRKLK